MTMPKAACASGLQGDSPMNSKERFYGWQFGDSPRDRAVLAIYRQYLERGEDFADHVKDIVFAYHNGDLVESGAAGSAIEGLEKKIDEIRQMLKSGRLQLSEQQGTDDDELYSILGDMGT